MGVIAISRYLAIALGIVTPILETIRRWHTWTDYPPALFDDYVLGGLLLFGAWRVGSNPRAGQKFLTAAWGFALGLVYFSFFSQLDQMRHGIPDPAPVSSEWVLAVKGVGFLLVLIGFVTSLGQVPTEN